jgi:hypothetical protein
MVDTEEAQDRGAAEQVETEREDQWRPSHRIEQVT